MKSNVVSRKTIEQLVTNQRAALVSCDTCVMGTAAFLRWTSELGSAFVACVILCICMFVFMFVCIECSCACCVCVYLSMCVCVECLCVFKWVCESGQGVPIIWESWEVSLDNGCLLHAGNVHGTVKTEGWKEMKPTTVRSGVTIDYSPSRSPLGRLKTL
ncbi:hypothetical protein QTP70_007649 [Hemibagrus guttatus]|uniref:Uncharacterized protein n=1 Tax=Hemibagrus guttatus TaxID=175788 RepID=A0AAE0RC53_9TELE|nr:hypothetical protein QTP70_007649 [Hemibagrus guttatus]